MGRIDPEQLAVDLARVAADHKAENVVVLDVRGLTAVADYLVICSGTSERQMHTVAQRVEEYAWRVGERPYGVSGRGSDVWVLVDFVDVVVHIFSREAREYYALEMLWGDARELVWQRSETA